MMKATQIKILLDILMKEKIKKIACYSLKTLRGSGIWSSNKLSKGNFDNYGIKIKNRTVL